MPATKLGIVIGSTRVSRSATSSGSLPAKLSRTPTSLCSANSSAARLAAMPSTVGSRSMILFHSSRAWSSASHSPMSSARMSMAPRRQAFRSLASASGCSRSRAKSGFPNSSPRSSSLCRVSIACACAQVLGVEALHTRDVRHTHKLLINHISAIRRINIFSHTKCVLVLESNLAFESQHLLHALENAKVKNWVSLSEGQQGSLGWLTTAERKEQMCLLLREAMNVGRIGLSPFFFSTELQPHEARQRIKDELSSYCVINEAPKTTFGKFRKTYTGKLYGKQDDLAIALQLAMIGCQKFFQDPKYRSFRPDDYATPIGLNNAARPRGMT